MTTLMIVLALLAPFAGGSEPARPGTRSSAAAADSTARSEEAPPFSWNLTPSRVARGQLWANVGYGRIYEQYAHDRGLVDAGDAVPLPSSLKALAGSLGITISPEVLPEGVDGTVQGHAARVSGSISVTNLHMGGSYELLRRPSFAVAVGADLGLSQQRFQAERITLSVENATVSIPAYGYENVPLEAVAAQMGLEIPASLPSEQVVQSGFRAQSALFFAEMKHAFVSARLGYHLDLGPEGNLEEQRRESTDRQDAFLFGASARRGFGQAVFFGGADAYVTRSAEAHGLSYDRGDLYAVNGGLAWDFGIGELGAAVTLRYRTAGQAVSAFGGMAFSGDVPSGYHVGLAPYFSLSPRGAGFTAYVKGGVQDEYRDYTLSLAGENEFAPRMGATFGLVYDL